MVPITNRFPEPAINHNVIIMCAIFAYRKHVRLTTEKLIESDSFPFQISD